MADIEGTGSTFGGAFSNMLGKVGMGGARGSYTRTTPVGQFRQLFGSDRGYKAMQDAGLNVKQTRTLEGWLDGTSHPSKKNAAAISRAYEAMQKGGTPEWVRKGRMDIKGPVANGNDVRNRGTDNTAPLRVDLSSASPATWDAIDDAHAAGASDDEIEELAAEGIVDEDIPSSGGWGFPGGGSGYTVGVSR